MPYQPKIVEQIKLLPMSNLGAKLGRWAVYHDLSVQRLALATGATRQSVYNWLKGGEVFVAYRPRVIKIIKHLEAAKDVDSAWRAICKDFDLKA